MRHNDTKCRKLTPSKDAQIYTPGRSKYGHFHTKMSPVTHVISAIYLSKSCNFTLSNINQPKMIKK